MFGARRFDSFPQICDILELAEEPAAASDASADAQVQPPLHKVGLRLIEMILARIFQTERFQRINLVYVSQVEEHLTCYFPPTFSPPSAFSCPTIVLSCFRMSSMPAFEPSSELHLIVLLQILSAIIKLDRTTCPYIAQDLKRMEEELSNTSAEFHNFTTRKQSGEDEFRRDLGEPIEFGQSMEDSVDQSMAPANASGDADLSMQFLDYRFGNDRRSLILAASEELSVALSHLVDPLADSLSLLAQSDKWKQH
eukprot:758169-Hanusia_phi.AAC.1